MDERSSLSDYLFELRRGAKPARLAAAMTAGVLASLTGILLGARFVALTGLGLAVAGVCGWARVNQLADGRMDEHFAAEPSARDRQLRVVGVIALGVAGIGALLFFYSFVVRTVMVATGM